MPIERNEKEVFPSSRRKNRVAFGLVPFHLGMRQDRMRFRKKKKKGIQGPNNSNINPDPASDPAQQFFDLDRDPQNLEWIQGELLDNSPMTISTK